MRGQRCSFTSSSKAANDWANLGRSRGESNAGLLITPSAMYGNCFDTKSHVIELTVSAAKPSKTAMGRLNVACRVDSASSTVIVSSWWFVYVHRAQKCSKCSLTPSIRNSSVSTCLRTCFSSSEDSRVSLVVQRRQNSQHRPAHRSKTHPAGEHVTVVARKVFKAARMDSMGSSGKTRRRTLRVAGEDSMATQTMESSEAY